MMRLITAMWPAFFILMVGCARGNAQRTATTAPESKRISATVLSAEDLFKQVSPSVFVVVSLNAAGAPIQQGSAVVTGPSLLTTNYHVIKGGTSYRVLRGKQGWPARLVATNPDHDLAELKVEKLDAPVVVVRQSSSLVVGEHVYAIGAPEGLELTLSEGLISSLRQSGDERVIQTTAAISPGSSGGGLFDTGGRLVGITSAFFKEGESLNFALPAESILSVRSATEWVELGSRAYQAGTHYDKLSKSEKAAQSYKEAEDAYAQALRLNPNDGTAWVNLADALSAGMNCQQAINAYQQALRLKPDDERAWVKLGREWSVSSLKSDSAKAATAYQRALRLQPDDEDAWARLGVEYSHLEQHDKALTALQSAHALIKADDEDAWRELGYSYYKVGQLKQAVESAQHALQLKPSDTLAWIILGYAYSGMRDRPGVMKVYEKLKILNSKIADEFFKDEVLPK